MVTLPEGKGPHRERVPDQSGHSLRVRGPQEEVAVQPDARGYASQGREETQAVLSPEQLQRLLDAASPFRSPTLTVTRGERKGQQVAEVTAAVRAARERDGRRRALIYLTAAYTGFRKDEFRSLKVKHLRLDEPVPAVHLPGRSRRMGRTRTSRCRPRSRRSCLTGSRVRGRTIRCSTCRSTTNCSRR